MKLVGNVNIVYGNLMSENSEDYAQKPQQNNLFMNSASVLYPEPNHLQKPNSRTYNSVEVSGHILESSQI